MKTGGIIYLLLLLLGLHRSTGRYTFKEKLREDRVEDLPEELTQNLFKVGEEVLLLPEVESNLNFEKMKFAAPGDLRQQKELRDSRFWGRFYINKWPYPIQYMQAHFGQPAPDGVRQILIAPDTYFCPEAEKVESADFEEGAIVVALRGKCTFGDKARAGLSKKASAVVIVNNEDGLDHLSAPDAHDIGISVVSIPRDEGKVLIHYLASSEKALQGSLVPINCAKREGAKIQTCDPCTEQDEEYVEGIMKGGYINLPSGTEIKHEFLLAKFGSALKENVPYDVVIMSEEDSCKEYNFHEGETKDKLVIAKRGFCKFVEKAKLADEAGAAGLVVVNHATNVMSMGCEPRWEGVNITIPVISATDIFGAHFFQPIDEVPTSVSFEHSSTVSGEGWESLNELLIEENWPKSFGAAKNLYENMKLEIGNSYEKEKALSDVWSKYHTQQKNAREGLKEEL